MANGIRKLRTRYGMTQAQLAERMYTDAAQISRWERGVEALTVAAVIDLAIVFDCDAGEVRGFELSLGEEAHSPFVSCGDYGLLFGTIAITTKASEYEYPICRKAKESILSQLNEMEAARDDRGAKQRRWLYCWTLDNKILYINPQSVRRVALTCDDEEAAPRYFHPQVYRAAERIETEGTEHLGPVVKRELDALIEVKGLEAAERETDYIHIVYEDGSDLWSMMIEEWDTQGFWAFTLSYTDVPANTFVRIRADPATFINIDNTAIVEVPSDAYHRLNAIDWDGDSKGHLRLVSDKG